MFPSYGNQSVYLAGFYMMGSLDDKGLSIFSEASLFSYCLQNSGTSKLKGTS